jgi:Ca-activated chloride channel family protein
MPPLRAYPRCHCRVLFPGSFMLRAFIAVVLALFLPFTAQAQDAPGHPRAILVLDGSGSMWGQIDGVNKIVIAREVIGGLLDSLPADMELGLMAYGHRTKGDCNDIELLYEPGTDRAAIARAVNAINPKGKTPLSAAVIAAAEALKYTEEPATVILVSDGIETCNYDPCAVGRQLEETGVNFTAHVIGFDVAEPEARAQLQCLAEATGGSFRTAANAEELSRALEVVAAPVAEPAPPEPAKPAVVPAAVRFHAVDGFAGPEITEGLVWTVTTEDGGVALDHGGEAVPVLTLAPGRGHVSVTRLADEATAEKDFTVFSGEDMRITLELPEFRPPATLEAPAAAPAGSLVPVTWTGPNQSNDYVAAATPGASRSDWREYRYLRDGEGQVVSLRMPAEPGSYEIRYILSEGGKVLAARPIEVTPLDISLTPPEGASIGLVAQVGWSGPDYERDYIAVARPGARDNDYETYAYTVQGNPASVSMPPVPGTYELRYVLGASGHVVARVPFSVADTTAGLTAPAEAPAGATIAVGWSGPDAQRDYVAIARVGSRDSDYQGYSYTASGNPVELRLPQAPGDYELRYVLNQDSTVLARVPIALTPVSAGLEAPASAPAGSTLSVGWTGPDYSRDFVAIAPAGADDGDYVSYAYTRNGNPARFTAPGTPGDYELRYFANDNGTAVLARRPISIAPVSATLEAAPSVPAAGLVSVRWTGPAGPRDYIAIAEAGSGRDDYLTYEYTRGGSPAEIQAPSIPGSYELRYIQSADHSFVLATVPLEVTPVSASLEAPASGPAGGSISVGWSGPGSERDYIVVARPGDGPDSYESYEYTRRGNPLELDLPDTPGPYELRYILAGPTREVIARRPLSVE